MRPIPLVDHANLVPARRADLQRAIEPLRTLADVLRWARNASPAWTTVAVVTQDEYTHDVVFGAEGQPYLVFDTT